MTNHEMPGESIKKQLPGWLAPLLVFIFTFAVFLPALKNGFVDWDDLHTLVKNRHYRGLGPAQLKWMFTTFYLGPYQPLSWLSLGLDYLVWGMDPFGYHLTNVILHCFNAVVFYFLCLKLLALSAGGAIKERAYKLTLAAVFAALFFAVHPLRVESVAWVTERRDVLCGLFYLLTLLWYIKPRSAGGENLSFRRRHLLPLSAFLLALLSKGMAVSLPVTLLVLDVYPLKRLPGDPRLWFSAENRRVWLEKLPFFALAAIFAALGYAGQAKGIVSWQEGGLAARAAQVLYGLVFYLEKTLLPTGLSPLYKLPAGFGPLSGAALFSGAAAAALTAAVIILRRRWPAGLAVWLCYLAALAPVAGIVKFGVQAAADRYTYLPCLGFAALAGAGFFACRQSANKALRNSSSLSVCLIIIVLSGLTWRQQGFWRDSETLWTHTLALNPGLDVAHNNLAGILEKRGESAPAALHYREALRLNPKNAQAWNNVGKLFAAQGEIEQAAAHYREAFRLDPGYAEAHYNLALLLAEHGKTEEAAGEYLEALRINPELAEAHNNLAGLLAAQGKTEEAALHCRAALEADPELAEAHNNLAGLLAAQGRLDEAAEHYREALRINPAFTQARNNLARVLAAQPINTAVPDHSRKKTTGN